MQALIFFCLLTVLTAFAAESPAVKKWEKGKGWGWVWGKDDEIGALNEMTDASRLRYSPRSQ